jgi:hypothetical protein
MCKTTHKMRNDFPRMVWYTYTNLHKGSRLDREGEPTLTVCELLVMTFSTKPVLLFSYSYIVYRKRKALPFDLDMRSQMSSFIESSVPNNLSDSLSNS